MILKHPLIVDFENWTFPIDSSDWVNNETGESLTGYAPPLQLSYLLNELLVHFIETSMSCTLFVPRTPTPPYVYG